jgi:hypothetical protein
MLFCQSHPAWIKGAIIFALKEPFLSTTISSKRIFASIDHY